VSVDLALKVLECAELLKQTGFFGGQFGPDFLGVLATLLEFDLVLVAFGMELLEAALDALDLGGNLLKLVGEDLLLLAERLAAAAPLEVSALLLESADVSLHLLDVLAYLGKLLLEVGDVLQVPLATLLVRSRAARTPVEVVLLDDLETTLLVLDLPLAVLQEEGDLLQGLQFVPDLAEGVVDLDTFGVKLLVPLHVQEVVLLLLVATLQGATRVVLVALEGHAVEPLEIVTEGDLLRRLLVVSHEGVAKDEVNRGLQFRVELN
jgi:hypothetical protein